MPDTKSIKGQFDHKNFRKKQSPKRIKKAKLSEKIAKITEFF